MSKKSLYALTDNILFERLIAMVDHIDREPKNILRVLTYHRIDDDQTHPDRAPDLLSATPHAFEQQIAFIKKTYQPVSVEQVIAYYQQGVDLPERAILVTFDDAYDDFKAHAWSALKHHEIPVVLFVPTAYPDNPSRSLWWDQLYHAVRNTSLDSVDTPVGTFALTNSADRVQTYKQLGNYFKTLPHTHALEWLNTFCETLGTTEKPENAILGWDELRQLAEEGVTMAPHTHTHPLLHRIDHETVREEITRSWQDLRSQIGEVAPVLAYPGGGISDQVIDIVKQENFQLAFTTIRGVNNLKSAHPLLLKRINIGYSTTIPMIRAQCLPSVAHIG